MGVADCLGNIANLYKMYGDPLCKENQTKCKKKTLQKAINYYHKSLGIYEEIGDQHLIALILSNIGSIYNEYGDPSCSLSKIECLSKGKEIALVYSLKSLRLREKINDYKGIMHSSSNLGRLYLNMNNISEAKKYATKGLLISRKIGSPEIIKNTSFTLSKIYEKEGNFKQALSMYKTYKSMKDSLVNEHTKKEIAKQESKYKYEKQKIIDDAEHKKLLTIEQEEKKKQKALTFFSVGVLVLVILFLAVVFNRLKITRKQKEVIEHQKFTVEKAHEQLEKKNKEITDSIKYAKRIQSAILPPSRLVKQYLENSFILYKPKDIVAGDFYWMEVVQNKVLFAAAGCTGHGVPGAMVSVICNNGLNRSVREHNLTLPGDILDKTREIVIQEFEKSEEDVKDGMDIAICCLEENKLQYAGANNPLWIIRNGEIIEHKADKQPIGNSINPTPYNTTTITLENEDTIYIFSDGYVDQFGGEKGKKLKKINFKNLLLSIQDKNMEQQKVLIDKKFEEWRGENEQVDDVCIVGVKFKI